MENLTSSHHYIASVIRIADRNNLETDKILEEAGLNARAARMRSQRINTAKLAKVVWQVSNELQDETLGLTTAPSHPGTFYTIGELAIHQPNLHLAINRGIRFTHQVTNGYELALKVSGHLATLSIKLPQPELDKDRLLTDLIMLGWHRLCSWLIGDNIALASASFAFPPPPHVDEYSFLYACPRQFNQSESSFSFHASYLKKQIVQNEASLKTFMYECPYVLFVKPPFDHSITSEVRQIVSSRINLGQGDICLNQVSEKMRTTNRTLRRRLSEEGTSFQTVKDTVRRDMAIYLLTQKGLPVGEVSAALGFSEPGVFIRAFKAWSGLTPGAFKREKEI